MDASQHTQQYPKALFLIVLGIGSGLLLFGSFDFLAKKEGGPALPITQEELAKKATTFAKEVKDTEQAHNALEKAHQHKPKNLAEIGYFTLHAAEFSGISKNGDRWRVYADKAVQPNHESASLYLDGIIATAERSTPLTLEATKGIFNEAEESLTFSQSVTGQMGVHKGVARVAKAFLVDETVKGEALFINGPRIDFQAATFFADLATEKAKFTNNVQVKLLLKEKAQ